MTLPPGAPPALLQVAQRFQATSRGIVSYRMHRTFDVHAGMQSRHEDLVMEGVCVDGATAKVRILSYTIDGRPASSADEVTTTQAWEHPPPGNVFAPPFDARNFEAYQYRGAGPETIAFTSSIRDAAHGDGTFSYDKDDNVVAYRFHPNALPPHAKTAEINDRRAEVLPGYWAVTQETQSYSGSYAIFAGAGAITMDYSDFQQFPDLASALRAI